MLEQEVIKFSQIFTGLDRAYGYYQPKNSQKGNGKEEGILKTVTKPVTLDIYKSHLEKTHYSIGIIPIREDNTCCWGVIDVDIYPIDYKEVITKIRKLELPLVPCRSKSGGMHIFMFVPEGIKAAEMKQKLKESALSIGYPGSEIFPKQTEIRSDRGDTGNWLNLPYGIGMRYAFNDDGSAASLQEFFQLYDKYKLTKEQFNNLTIKDPDEILAGGPPCLNAILAKGSVGKGERNNTMFNICVYFIKTKKENWENEVSKVNEQYFKPKLEHTELNNIIASAKEKEYNYQCNKDPLEKFCDKKACVKKEFGVGTPDHPTFGNLTVVETDPPLWFMDVDDSRIELTTEQLQMFEKFQRRCMEVLHTMPPLMKKSDWIDTVNAMMAEGSLNIIEVSEEDKFVGRFKSLFNDFLIRWPSSSENEDVLLQRKNYINDGKIFFKAEVLEEYIKNAGFKIDQNILYKTLRFTIKAEERQIKIKKDEHIRLSVRVRVVDDPKMRTIKLDTRAKNSQPEETPF